MTTDVGRVVVGRDYCACGELKLVLDPPAPCFACEAYEAVRTSPSYIDLDEFDDLCGRAGRVHRPGLLAEAYAHAVIDDDVVVRMVGRAWCLAEFPDRSIGWDAWSELFAIAGYTVDGNPAAPPTSPIRLWRAAPPDHRAGHSWSEDIEVARQFLAVDYRDMFEPVLWTAVAEPWRLLARLVAERPRESQYVVETTGLAINQADEPLALIGNP